ncbi:hypothetical protein BDZ94DRAFT_1253699 [Collybia nuda]|uniref:Pentatricopeptide repeat-containing protein n=1 Tax=Collybia nuda TaxID=64659 RepID=A0A9P6CLY8_9AGAR|nr:hypothetical protein BDZ94DRAFT_1253699 [Collybia nuda]
MLIAFRRSLVHNRHFFIRARLCSSATNTSFESPTNYKPSLSRLKAFLKKPANHPNTHAYINTYLDHSLTTVSNATALYEELIATLLRHHYYKEAIEIYQRMLNEDIVPTLETRAQIVALAFSLSESADEISKAVDALLIDNDLTQGHVARILEHALHFEASSSRVSRIQDLLVARTNNFIPTQGLVSKLVEAQVRDGDVDAAFATILRHGDNETTGPYAAMINALREIKSNDVQSLNLILGLMYEKSVKPDLAILNGLLSWELYRQSIPKLWKVYHIMKLESEKNAIIPDATTFGVLFSSFLQEGAKDMAISPRSVYRDMIFFHKRMPMKINTHLLNIALRAFVEGRDYAGAFVILRSFRVYRVRVSARTYSVTLQHIMHRLVTAIEDKTAAKYRWPCAFLRVSAQELKKLKADAGLADAIMAFSKAPKLEITRSIMEKRSDDVGKYITPSLEQLKRDITPHAFSSLPLERILLRAISAGTPDPRHMRPNLYVAERIRDAKKDMVLCAG